jgi:diacylglycerol kinase (ATP)
MQPFVIMNPRAGRSRRGPDADAVRVAFARHGLAAEVVFTEGPGHATALARDAEGDPVVAVGGDGTLHEIIQELDLSGQRLGVIPVGTGNDFAWQHGIPQELDAAVARIAAERERPVDLGACSCGRFHNNLGLGFEAEVNRLSHAVRGVRGPALYFVALAQALARLRTYELELAWEGGAFTGRLLTAALLNGRRVGGAFQLSPAARTDDAALDLVTVEAMGRLSIFTALGPVLRGREPRDGRIGRARTPWLRLAARSAVPVYIDGEYVGGHLTLTAEVLPGALRLL